MGRHQGGRFLLLLCQRWLFWLVDVLLLPISDWSCRVLSLLLWPVRCRGRGLGGVCWIGFLCDGSWIYFLGGFCCPWSIVVYCPAPLVLRYLGSCHTDFVSPIFGWVPYLGFVGAAFLGFGGWISLVPGGLTSLCFGGWISPGFGIPDAPCFFSQFCLRFCVHDAFWGWGFESGLATLTIFTVSCGPCHTRVHIGSLLLSILNFFPHLFSFGGSCVFWLEGVGSWFFLICTWSGV